MQKGHHGGSASTNASSSAEASHVATTPQPLSRTTAASGHVMFELRSALDVQGRVTAVDGTWLAIWDRWELAHKLLYGACLAAETIHHRRRLRLVKLEVALSTI